MKIKRFAPLAGCIALTLALVAAPALTSRAQDSFSEAQKEEIGRIVRDYLLANPTVLEEVIAELEAHQARAQQEAQRTALIENREKIFNSQKAFVAGNPEGDVTLVEFFDYNCGYCKRMLPAIMDLAKSDPDLRIVFKEWPVLGEDSADAARVSVAVMREAPEQYFEYHTRLLAERGRVGAERALALAEEMGIDRAALERGMTAPEVEATLIESLELGNQLGLRGTPTYILDDEILMGAVGYETLKSEIAAVRENGCELC